MNKLLARGVSRLQARVGVLEGECQSLRRLIGKVERRVFPLERSYPGDTGERP